MPVPGAVLKVSVKYDRFLQWKGWKGEGWIRCSLGGFKLRNQRNSEESFFTPAPRPNLRATVLLEIPKILQSILSVNTGISVCIPASDGELTPSQIIHSENPVFSLGSDSSLFYLQDPCEARRGPRLTGKRTGCTAETSLYSGAPPQVPVGER